MSKKQNEAVDALESRITNVSRRGFIKGTGAVAGAVAVESVAGATSAKAAKTQLNITTWMGVEPGRKEAWESIIGKFNAQSTTSEVKLSGWPFAQYVNQVLTGLEAGTLTDCLLYTSDAADE